MLKVNLYQKMVRGKDGNTFPTYFVGAKKGDGVTWMDCRLANRFKATKEGIEAVAKLSQGARCVGLAFRDDDGYFFTDRKDKMGNTILGKDGKPLVRMVIVGATAVIDPVELPKKEKKEKTMKADDFFDTTDDDLPL